MAKRKLPRLLIDPTQILFARDLLEYDELGMLFEALGEYLINGLLPDADAHAKAWNVCFNQMREVIDRDAAAYAEKCETNRRNRQKAIQEMYERPESETINDDRQRQSTTVNDRSQKATNVAEIVTNTPKMAPNTTQRNLIEEVGGNKPASPAPPPSEMQTLRENHQRAEQLIRRFGLPDNDPTLEAVLEDAEAHGWDKLEAALQTAALHNSRQKISVVFYRSILTAEPRREPTNVRDPYANFAEF